jgi:hypothetical protein
MNDLRQAAEMALEALESKYIVNCGAWMLQQDQAAEALRQAIAEAEKQEPIKRSFSADVGRLLSTGKGFYDDGTPIDYKEVQIKIEGVSEEVFECKEVRIPRPPKREWVGLDPETMRNTTLQFNQGALWAERYLKEKNT